MPEEFPESTETGLKRRVFDLFIIGGGILGTLVARLAARAGIQVLCVRLGDGEVPRSETQRNQAWLQSGFLYPTRDFRDRAHWKQVARMTFQQGRRMLKVFGIDPGDARAVIRTPFGDREAALLAKARDLRWGPRIFRRLEPDEARDRLGDYYVTDSAYYLFPDTHFDEAWMLEAAREAALAAGAEFREVGHDATIEAFREGVRFRWGELDIEAPVCLLAAGAGCLPLLEQLGIDIGLRLRQTPMLVHAAPSPLSAPIFVDVEHGFSAVCHRRGVSAEHGVFAVGTRLNSEGAHVPWVPPENRTVTPNDVATFRGYLSPSMRAHLPGGRFTAGIEVMPPKDSGPSFLEPWTMDVGPVLFASPGRATLAQSVAETVFQDLMTKVDTSGRGSGTWQSPSVRAVWSAPVHMHTSDSYSYDDAAEV